MSWMPQVELVEMKCRYKSKYESFDLTDAFCIPSASWMHSLQLLEVRNEPRAQRAKEPPDA